MAREFITLKQADIDKKLAQSLKAREYELMCYDLDLDAHNAAITELSGKAWDESNKKYQNMGRDQLVAAARADSLDSTTIQNLAELATLDYHLHNAEVVKGELARVERHYNIILEKLPAGAARDAAIAAISTE